MHAGTGAIAACASCGAGLCASCRSKEGGRNFCAACAAVRAAGPLAATGLAQGLARVQPARGVQPSEPDVLPALLRALPIGDLLRSASGVAPYILTVIGGVVTTTALLFIALVGFPWAVVAIVPLIAGALATALGLSWARQKQSADRARATAQLHQRVLGLAGRHGARLSAAQLVRDLGLAIPDAEALLTELVRAGLAEPEADDIALAVVYRFPGLLPETSSTPTPSAE